MSFEIIKYSLFIYYLKFIVSFPNYLMLKNIPDTFTKNVRDILILDNKFVYLLNSSLYSSRKSFITPFISLLNDIPVCFFIFINSS